MFVCFGGPDSVGSLVAKAWVVGFLWMFFPVPGMWVCFCWFCLLAPGCGVLLVLLDGLCWLCPYVGYWCCLSGGFVFGLLPLCPYFRGGAVRFSSVLGAF